MSKHIDLTGKKFGRLTVIRRLEDKRYGNGSFIYNCICDCGNYKLVSSKHLLSGATRSCGCLTKEMVIINQVKAVEKSLYKGTKPCMLTSKIKSTNSSGYKGVAFDKRRTKWRARITFQKREIHLGYYENVEDAVKARKEAEEKYFQPIIEEFKEGEING
jgi:hypothetical protein